MDDIWINPTIEIEEVLDENAYLHLKNAQKALKAERYDEIIDYIQYARMTSNNDENIEKQCMEIEEMISPSARFKRMYDAIDNHKYDEAKRNIIQMRNSFTDEEIQRKLDKAYNEIGLSLVKEVFDILLYGEREQFHLLKSYMKQIKMEYADNGEIKRFYQLAQNETTAAFLRCAYEELDNKNFSEAEKYINIAEKSADGDERRLSYCSKAKQKMLSAYLQSAIEDIDAFKFEGVIEKILKVKKEAAGNCVLEKCCIDAICKLENGYLKQVEVDIQQMNLYEAAKHILLAEKNAYCDGQIKVRCEGFKIKLAEIYLIKAKEAIDCKKISEAKIYANNIKELKLNDSKINKEYTKLLKKINYCISEEKGRKLLDSIQQNIPEYYTMEFKNDNKFTGWMKELLPITKENKEIRREYVKVRHKIRRLIFNAYFSRLLYFFVCVLLGIIGAVCLMKYYNRAMMIIIGILYIVACINPLKKQFINALNSFRGCVLLKLAIVLEIIGASMIMKKYLFLDGASIHAQILIFIISWILCYINNEMENDIINELNKGKANLLQNVINFAGVTSVMSGIAIGISWVISWVINNYF